MKDLSNLSIRAKLRNGFGRVFLVGIISMVLSLIAILVLSDRYPKFVDGYGFSQGTLGFALSCIGATDGAVHDSLAFDDPEMMETIKSEFYTQADLVISYVKETQELLIDEEFKNSCDSVIASWTKYVTLATEIVESDDDVAIRRERVINELDPLYEDTSKMIGMLVNNLITKGLSRETTLDRLGKINIFVTILCIVAILIISKKTQAALINAIATPMTACTDRISLLANGDIHTPVTVIESEDEIGELTAKTKVMVDYMSSMITSIIFVLNEFSVGNFAVKVDDKYYVGDYHLIKEKIDEVSNILTNTIRNIQDSSDQVANSATQMADAAQSLAEGSTDQAQAIDQLLRGIKNFSVQVSDTAVKANDAHDKTVEVKKCADNSSMSVSDMVESMNRINKASEAIDAIANDISDIAGKTNLLSLNASIEAARAGDAGRGFAVVANEIMHLANQCKTAVENTRKLIEECKTEVHNGTESVGEVQRALLMTVDMITNIQKYIADIHSLTEHQNQSMSGLSTAIDQISSIVESNSAAAEESSAVSEEMKAQADILNNIIREFKIQ